MIEIIPNWHPIFVHFTIALLTVATLLKVASLLVGGESLSEQMRLVARWNLWLGAGFVVVTVISGVIAYNTVAHDTPSHAAMTDHRNWALVTSALFLALAVWSVMLARAGKIWGGLFVAMMLISTALLGTTAWKGGEVVYRYGLGVMSLPKADSHGHADGEAHDHGTEKASGHDNSDGHHDNSDGHHDEKPVHDNIDDHPHDNSDGHHDKPGHDDGHDNSEGHHDQPPTSADSPADKSKTKDDHYADGHTH